jgi:nucleotide-binding universal stress UspA family protein
MYRKILVGYDDSDQAKDALALGQQLANATGAEVVVGGVFLIHPRWHGGIDPRIREDEVEFGRKLEAAAIAAEAVAEPYPSTSPARGLHELAEEIGADLIVVGSSHPGPIGQSLDGGVGVALLHGSPCAVAIAPRGYGEHSGLSIDTITVGFDGSAESGLALTTASQLAGTTGAKLKLVSVVETPVVGTGKSGADGYHALKDAVEQQMRDQLAKARNAVLEEIEVEATLSSGDPVRELVGAASTPRTLLVVGSRGYGPVHGVLAGSVSRRLARSASCPLIVTSRGTHQPRETGPTVEVANAS